MFVKVKRKNVLIFCCLFFLAAGAAGAYAQTLGDVNGDGTINIVDALRIAQYYIGLPVSLTPGVADVDCSGTIDIVDALRVAQYYIGLISQLPCGGTGPGYVRGVVLVGFYDNVTLEQANSLVESFGLTWENHFPTSFAAWIEVSSNAEQYVAELTASPIVSWAEISGKNGGDPAKTYIIAQSKVNVTQLQMEALVAGMSDAKIVEYAVASKWGMVNVPVGSESAWVTTFAAQSIVKYAQLDNIIIIDF